MFKQILPVHAFMRFLSRFHGFLLNRENSRFFVPIAGFWVTFFFLPYWGYYFYKSAGDTYFNLWFALYYAQNFQKFFFLPDCINAIEASVLNPLPLFYAHTLHWPAALLSRIFPVRTAFWIIVVSVTYIEYLICAFPFSRLTNSRYKGCIIAAIIVFSSYAMNNLYARGALAEYVATALATAGLCALLSIIVSVELKRQWLMVSACLFALAFNMHPITLMYSTIFFLPVALWPIYIFFTRSRKIVLDILVFLSVVCLLLLSVGHFLYITRETHNILHIMNYKHFGATPLVYLPLVDNLILRIAPIPLCFMLFEGAPLQQQDFIMLTGQVNVPLLITAIYSIYALSKKNEPKKIWMDYTALTLSGFILLVSICLTYISVKPSGSEFIDSIIIGKGQFPYRLLTYINGLFILSLFVSLHPKKNDCTLSYKRLGQFLGLAALGVALYFLQMGTRYDFRINFINSLSSETLKIHRVKDFSTVPSCVYGYFDYTTPVAFMPETDADNAKRVDLTQCREEKNVWRSGVITVRSAETLRIPVSPFIWNHIYLCDIKTKKKISQFDSASLRANLIPAGLYIHDLPEGQYMLEARFEPPKTYSILRRLYYISLFVLLTGGMVSSWWMIKPGKIKQFKRIRHLISNIKWPGRLLIPFSEKIIFFSRTYWLYSVLVIILLFPFIYTLLHVVPEADDFCRAAKAQGMFDFVCGFQEALKYWLEYGGRYTHHFLVYFLGDVVMCPWGAPIICITVMFIYWIGYFGIFSTISIRGTSGESFFFATLALLTLCASFHSFDTVYMLATDALGIGSGNGLVLILIWMLCRVWFFPSHPCRWAAVGAIISGAAAAGCYEHAAVATTMAVAVAMVMALLYRHPNQRWFAIILVVVMGAVCAALFAPGNFGRRGDVNFSLMHILTLIIADGKLVAEKVLNWGYLVTPLAISLLLHPRWKQSLTERLSFPVTVLVSILGYAGLLSAIILLHAVADFRMANAVKLVASCLFLGSYWVMFIILGCGSTLHHISRKLPRFAIILPVIIVLLISPPYQKTAINTLGGNVLDFYRIQTGRWNWTKTRHGEDVVIPIPEISPYPVFAAENLVPQRLDFPADHWPNPDAAYVLGVKSITRQALSPSAAYDTIRASHKEFFVSSQTTTDSVQSWLFTSVNTGPNELFERDWLVLRMERPARELSTLLLVESERERLMPRRFQRWLVSFALKRKQLASGFISSLFGPTRTFDPEKWRVSDPEGTVTYVLPLRKPTKRTILAAYISVDGSVFARVYTRPQ